MNQIEVDARGLRCPLPVIRLAEVARDAPAGTTITVLATDPAARHDIPAWCRMRDHELRAMTEISDSATQVAHTSGEVATAAAGDHPAYVRFVVVVGSQPSKAAGGGSGSARSSRAM